MRGESVPRGWWMLPWALVGVLGLVAPWLLGGRAAAAREVLGGLSMVAVIAVLWAVWMEYRDWRHFAAYEARRGRARANPFTVLGRGLLWTLPLWAFVVVLAVSALNPAYVREGEHLVRIAHVGGLPLVVDPGHSRPGIFFLISLLTLFGMLTHPVCQLQRTWIRVLLWSWLINALVIAIVGFWYKFNGNGLVLGRFEPVAHYFFGPFFYKNHWAAFAVLFAAVGVGLLYREVSRLRMSLRGGGSGWIAGVIVLLLGLTLPVVDSRSGMLIFAFLLSGFFFVIMRRIQSLWGRVGGISLVLVIVAVLSLLTSGEIRDNWERTERQMASAESVNIDGIRFVEGPRTCWAMFQARPMWGWGYQSFKPMFIVFATDYFRDEQGRIQKRMEFAHNDWLQHLAEFGWLGSALLVAGVGLALRNGDRRVSSSPLPGWIGFGVLLVGVLALWEFPLSNPAVLTSAVLLLAIRKQIR